MGIAKLGEGQIILKAITVKELGAPKIAAKGC